MRLSTAAWWVWSLGVGTVFGVFELVSGLVEGHRVVPALIGAVVGGAVFGGLMGPLMARQARRNVEVFGSAPRADRRAIARASFRGPLPTDPALRQATVRYTRSHLEGDTRARRVRTLLICVAFVVLSIVVSVYDGEWWFLLIGIFFLALWIVGVVTQSRMRKRLVLLEPDR